MYQRGKNVVSASSVNTTRSQFCDFAWSSRSIIRLTTDCRLSALWIGPLWAAATRKIRLTGAPSALAYPQETWLLVLNLLFAPRDRCQPHQRFQGFS